jgi:protein SDA1
VQICPSLLIKKDRGRPTNPKARPKAYGEVDVVSDVPGVELLQTDDNNEGDVSDTVGSTFSDSDDDHENYEISAASDNEENQLDSDVTGSDDDEVEDDDDSDANDDDEEEEEEEEVEEKDMEVVDAAGHEPNGSDITNDDARASETGVKESKGKKRKSPDFDGKLLAADASLQALKRLAGVTMGRTPDDSTNGILSNEDFQRIKELKVS